MKSLTPQREKPQPQPDPAYDIFLRNLQLHLQRQLNRIPTRAIFCTNALPERLWSAYLDHIEVNYRQHYNCHTCRNFIHRFGGLVTVTNWNGVQSLMWSLSQVGVPQQLRRAYEAARQLVEQSNITGIFYSRESILGQPTAGGWSHLSVELPDRLVNTETLLTPGQAKARSLENWRLLKAAVGRYRTDTLQATLAILSTDRLYRGEKIEGAVKFLAFAVDECHRIRQVCRDSGLNDFDTSMRVNNFLWRQVASVPEAYFHVNSSVLGTLLDDLQNGVVATLAAARFAEKMKPTQYQVSSTPVKQQAVVQAEKLVSQLGLERSFDRRFAKLSEMRGRAIWLPRTVRKLGTSKPEPSLFSHLKTSQSSQKPAQRAGQTQTLTWVKFVKTLLPQAIHIELRVPAAGPFGAMTTAVHPDAPPLFQWDSPERRNPVAYYTYSNGPTKAQAWSLTPEYTPVTAIMPMPWRWEGYKQVLSLPEVSLFVLHGAKDLNTTGLAIIPECLRHELHPVRAVIQAHSEKGRLQGLEDASVCGLAIDHGQMARPIELRVLVGNELHQVVIDRWD